MQFCNDELFLKLNINVFWSVVTEYIYVVEKDKRNALKVGIFEHLVRCQKNSPISCDKICVIHINDNYQ